MNAAQKNLTKEGASFLPGLTPDYCLKTDPYPPIPKQLDIDDINVCQFDWLAGLLGTPLTPPIRKVVMFQVLGFGLGKRSDRLS